MVLKPAFDYLNFRIHAKSRHGYGIHSPFIYDLFTRILKDDKIRFPEEVSSWHRSLRKNKMRIDAGNWGAGSRRGKSPKKSISELVRHTSVQPRHGRLLYYLAHEFQFPSVLELGTGIGVSTAYLRNALPGAQFISVEGAPEKVAFALKEFRRMHWSLPEFVNMDFDQFLKNYKPASEPLLAYIDGNHSYEPTMKYFRSLQKFSTEGSVMIFDDIYWSEGMKKAWEEIIRDTNTIVSIDMFHMGMILHRKGMSKENFLINY